MSNDKPAKTLYMELDPLMARDLDRIRRHWQRKRSQKGSVSRVVLALLREPIQAELQRIEREAANATPSPQD